MLDAVEVAERVRVCLRTRCRTACRGNRTMAGLTRAGRARRGRGTCEDGPSAGQHRRSTVASCCDRSPSDASAICSLRHAKPTTERTAVQAQRAVLARHVDSMLLQTAPLDQDSKRSLQRSWRRCTARTGIRQPRLGVVLAPKVLLRRPSLKAKCALSAAAQTWQGGRGQSTGTRDLRRSNATLLFTTPHATR